jgi:hypothetical protein
MTSRSASLKALSSFAICSSSGSVSLCTGGWGGAGEVVLSLKEISPRPNNFVSPNNLVRQLCHSFSQQP